MGKTRLEAFSDAVIAIILTIMVLELKPPHGTSFADLRPLLPVFLAYVLSFVYLGIYWNNHHHMIHTVRRVSGGILWANLHLLFWLSLVPFTTHWMGEAPRAAVPTAVYGFSLLMAAISYTMLQSVILRSHGPESTLAHAVGQDWKGKLSVALYLTALVMAFLEPVIAQILFVVIAGIWLVPDRRIERTIGEEEASTPSPP